MSAAVSPADPLSPMQAMRGETLDSQNPWPGLAAFREGDAPFFHGREADALDLFLLARRESVTVLFGVSGLGKTSLLFAGVFPALRAESYLPVYVRINHDERAPAPLIQILDAIEREAGREIDVPSRDVETLWEYFHRTDALLWSKQNEIVTPVLVFDQFEECFVEGRSTQARDARTSNLLTQIADLIEDRPPEGVKNLLDKDPDAAQKYDFGRQRYRVVISLRKDYLADLDELREQMPSIANRFPLKRMTGEIALREVVAKPGLIEDDDTAEAILRYVAGKSSPQEQLDSEGRQPLHKLHVEPALLSLFCRELNEARKAAGAPRISRALFLANRQEILKGFYDRCMQGRSRKVQMFVEEELLTQSGSRKSAAVEDIVESYGEVRDDIEALIDLRLLRREKRDGLEWIELTHDRLTGVVRESRDRRHDQEEIQRAQEEARQERLRRLEAEQREAERRRQLVIRTTLLGIAVVLAIVAAGFGIYATRQQAIANYQNGLFRFQEGRARSGLAYLARGLELDEKVDVYRWLGLQRVATSFSTAVFAGIFYAEWPLRTLSDSDGFDGAVLSGDGSRVLTIATDGRARLWDERSGPPIKPNPVYGNGVVAAFVSNDGSRFVTASRDGRVQSWNPPEEMSAHEVPLGAGFQCAAFNADGSRVVVASELPRTDPARVWHLPGERTVELDSGNGSVGTGRAVCPVGINADGTRVVTGWSDGGVRLWDASTGGSVGEPLQGRWRVTTVALSSDGARVVTGSNDGTVRLSDPQPAPMKEWEGHARAVTSVRFSPDGGRIVTASKDGTAQVWDARGGPVGLRVGPPLRHEDSVWSATFDASGTHIATASADGTVQVWDARPSVDTGRLLGDRGAPVRWAAFSPDGKRVVTAAGDSARLFDLRGGAEPRLLKRDGTGTVYTAAFSRDGALLATGSRDCTVRLWNGRTGDFIREVGRHGAAGALGCSVESVAFDSEGQRIVTASDDGTARLWDGGSATMLGELTGHTGAVRFAGFAHDGRIVTASAKEMRVWDGHTGSVPSVLPAPDAKIWGASISPDGLHLIIALDDCSAQVVDIADITRATIGERLRHSAPGAGCAVRSAAFSPNGELVVTASADRTARLWDARTGALLGAPLSHDDTVWAAAFSPDGTRVVTASQDGTARMWDVAPALSIRPRDLASFATAVAGARVDESGVATMAPDRDGALTRLRNRAAMTPGEPTPYVALLRRFFDRTSRSDSQ